MEKLSENFKCKLATILEYGVAYLIAHPELFSILYDDLNRIKKLHKLQKKYPDCGGGIITAMIETTFMSYIQRLTKFAFKYMRKHPETFYQIHHLCEHQKQLENQIQSRRKSSTKIPQFVADIYDETFTQINKLLGKLDAVESRMSEFKNSCNDSVHLNGNERAEEATLTEQLRRFCKDLENVKEKLESDSEKNLKKLPTTDEFNDDEDEGDENESTKKLPDESISLHGSCEDENATKIEVVENEISTSRQCRTICQLQETVDKIETLVNSMKSLQSQILEKSTKSQTGQKSLTLIVDCDDENSILPQFQTKSLLDGQMQFELKLNF